ncbi:MAG: hypothetical protein Q9195_003805 [Heterodermia aff. obscurata]
MTTRSRAIESVDCDYNIFNIIAYKRRSTTSLPHDFYSPDSAFYFDSGLWGVRPNTEILLLDKWQFEYPESETPLANPTASSTDTSRIVRSDYTSGPYADLVIEAQKRWRGEWGASGRYSQSGYIVVAKEGDTEMSTGGSNHVTLAYENAVRAAGDSSSIQLLKSEADIERASGYPITAGGETALTENAFNRSKGYLNRASGWADAAASIKFLRAKVKATKRVKFICGFAQELLYSPPARNSHQPSGHRAVLGVLLTSGQKILASQTILAAGPYTAGFTDLRAVCEARGQVITYVKLTPQELSQFPAEGNPCVMDASSGVFVVGPDREGYLKVTRGSKGYRNPVRITVPRDGQPDFAGLDTKTEAFCNGSDGISGTKEIETSVPWDGSSDEWQRSVPPDGEADCRAFLRCLFPSSSPLGEIASRAFERTRTCWYCDTRTADFVISYHPDYAEGSLFIATGGSGHGFKFLPVIGEKIVQVLKYGPNDRDDDHGNVDRALDHPKEDIRVFRSLWKFPKPRENDDGVVECEDGSRHGRGDLVFEECMKADTASER